jgi:2,4-dienoyl-CoA reductase-like NADH-dependent reductase (Old Yellow Enzyme family)
VFVEHDRPTGSGYAELTIGAKRYRCVLLASEFGEEKLHAAHGYLFSQFLSPRSNLREDEWGGDLAGRARFLLSVVRAIRAKVGADFPVGVKLNSADFQRGGFSFEDSQIVAGWLDEASIDLIEISGGTWEAPAMANIEGMEPNFDLM